MKYSLIVAVCQNNSGIGLKGKIPWMLRKEMAYFAKMTSLTTEEGKENAVIMGRKTWESIPAKFRPLKGRVNIVLTRTVNDFPSGVVSCTSFNEALDTLKKSPLSDKIENIWIIGGSSIYEEAMKNDLCHRLYITRIKADFECDTFFPEISSDYVEIEDENVPSGVQDENGLQYEYKVYEKRKSQSA